MKKLLCTLLALLLTCAWAIAQVPTVLWQKSYGGSDYDDIRIIRSTLDSNYILVGNTNSINGDLDGIGTDALSGDIWVTKVNTTGNIIWTQTYGGSGLDIANDIYTTTDSGYIVVGFTMSNDGLVSGYHGAEDIWVLRLNKWGDVLWQRCLGGSGSDIGYTIIATSDNGYLVGGITSSADGDVTDTIGTMWLVKLSSTGSILWQKKYGASTHDAVYGLLEKAPGQYIAAGFTASNDSNIHSHGFIDAWLVQINDTGAIVWQKPYGGSNLDVFNSICKTTDGHVLVAGSTASADGDVTAYHGGTTYGLGDMWVTKIDDTGALVWQKTYGGSNDEECKSVQTNISGLITLAGYTTSYNGDITYKKDTTDYWVVQVDSLGTMQWQKTLGGSSIDVGKSLVINADNSYTIAGLTNSNNGDITASHGRQDGWIVKLGIPENISTTTLTESCIQLFPVPCNNSLNVVLPCTAIWSVVVSNAYGIQVYNTSACTKHLEIATHNLANGLYTITAHGATHHITHSFVIQHN